MKHTCFSPSSPGFDSQHSKNISEEKIIDVAEVNQLHWLEESGQWLENVGQTHLVLASSKPVLQKGDLVTIHVPVVQGVLLHPG